MKKYSLGLDIGTNSVGWAVVDENNQLVKKNGFTFWGVRMFEEAKTAEERRGYRGARRRLVRRKQRIALLQNEFKDEIEKIDKYFFQRLNDSFYKKEDKLLQNQYTFFDDELTDKKYFELFPTIFHLRKYLLTTDEKADIRMIYLAIHHIIKYRGNFLNESESFDKKDNTILKKIFECINQSLDELKNIYEDDEDYFENIQNIDNDSFYNDLEKIINGRLGKNDKKKELLRLFGVEKKTLVNEVYIQLLVGSDAKISDITLLKNQHLEIEKINLDNPELETLVEKAISIVPDLQLALQQIINLKVIVDTEYLKKLLGDSSNLSESMVKLYDLHKKQLSDLKSFIRRYLPNKYDECFKKSEDKLNNYGKYIGMNSTNGNKVVRTKHCTLDDFYKYLKALFKEIHDESAQEEIDNIILQMDNRNYLLRQNSGSNGVLPMQLNLQELKIILNKQAIYYPFLNEKEDGLSRIDRIISIFKYKLPYFVGPLNRLSERSWMVKKDEYKDEQILPWNYETIIDLDQTAVNFIQRMQNKCTYLHGENDYCLPKKSLLFSEYNCLQYLNRLKIDGNEISKELKDRIFNDIFLKIKKPTRKNISEYIRSNEGYENADLISKIEEVTCDMSSYITFKEIFGKDFSKNYDRIEEIIKDVTIFKDKKILEKRLLEIYNLDKTIAAKIKGLNYDGYATLSKHLLAELVVEDEETGEMKGPIIQIMRDTNLNLQQIILGKEYHFIDAIDKYNKEIMDGYEEAGYKSFIENHLYVSPMMKRSLVQSYKIIEEIEKILKQPIDKYYIECARTNKAKKEVVASRYQQLKDLFNNCKEVIGELYYEKLNQQLDEKKDNLRSDKIYLYFTQLGKCMYTLKEIDFNDLIKDNSLYDIDHIYPQSLIKDDSLNNRVLTLKSYNNDIKGDRFLHEIEGRDIKKSEGFYKKLLDSKLITKEKYRRLTQKEVSPAEFERFVNRQLVSTNQSVSGLIELLKNYKHVDPSKIIYSKAENVSDFRRNYDILKSRTANNYHHAHDAYLNVVLGRVIDEYYKKTLYKERDLLQVRNQKYTINPERIFEKDEVIKNGKLIWNKNETLKLIKKNIQKRFDISETIRSYNPTKMYRTVTILPAGIGTIPIKITTNQKLTEKYGGLSDNSFAKYSIVKLVDKKDKEIYVLEAIPYNSLKNTDEYINTALFDNKKYKSFEIVVDNIKTNTIIEYEKKRFCIRGKTNDGYGLRNLIDRNFSYQFIRIIKYVEKYNFNLENNIRMEVTDEKVIISGNNKRPTIEIVKNDCKILLNEIMKMYKKDIYGFSVIKKLGNQLDNINFDEYTMETLMKIVTELLKLLKTNEKKAADLRSIGGSNNSGILYISKTLKPGMKFVSKSVTGYYKKIIFEVPN